MPYFRFPDHLVPVEETFGSSYDRAVEDKTRAWSHCGNFITVFELTVPIPTQNCIIDECPISGDICQNRNDIAFALLWPKKKMLV